MNVQDVQALLAQARYYRGRIDGDLGAATRRAIDIVRRNGGFDWAAWPEARQAVAAGQVILAAQGFEPGGIDGLAGHNTREALRGWRYAQANDTREVIDRVERAAPPPGAGRWPRHAEIEQRFGRAGGVEATAGTCVLPFPFPIAWNLVESVAHFSCHRSVAAAFQSVFAEAARHYGEAEYRRLRLDLYGGCFNNRNMRGGTRKSTHAYGAAVDLDPERNQLRWGRDRAAFARPEFNAFWSIVEAQGLVSLGRAADMDWMHFQAVRL
jgi:peptidoglycan hydrolase-like protein with peptidoglycan-binding domain